MFINIIQDWSHILWTPDQECDKCELCQRRIGLLLHRPSIIAVRSILHPKMINELTSQEHAEE